MATRKTSKARAAKPKVIPTENVPCEEYESLNKQLYDAMRREASVHMDSRKISPMARSKREQDTKRSVHVVEDRIRLHLEQCERCKAEGNKPLESDRI